jgi:hypothetical protein
LLKRGPNGTYSANFEKRNYVKAPEFEYFKKKKTKKQKLTKKTLDIVNDDHGGFGLVSIVKLLGDVRALCAFTLADVIVRADDLEQRESRVLRNLQSQGGLSAPTTSVQ